MRLSIDQLRKAAQKTINDEKSVNVLRAEAKRVLGPIIDTDVSLVELARAINERVAVLDSTGRGWTASFKPSAVLKFAVHQDSEVRRMAARLLPERFIGSFLSDKHPGVRVTAAKRLSLDVVREVLKRFPHDDELRVIVKQKALYETGVPNPKIQDEPFDMYGEERLGDSVKQSPGPDLSEEWYHEHAQKFLQDYGNNIEYQWENILTSNYCHHVKATSGVEIDEEKLLKSIETLIKEKEDLALERLALREVVENLRETADNEEPAFNESPDPVRELLDSGLSSSAYIEKANALFSVREITIPRALRKFRNHETTETIPMKAKLPHTGGIRPIDEQALDVYVKHWNDKQVLRGEPYKLGWVPDPADVRSVGFKAELK